MHLFGGYSLITDANDDRGLLTFWDKSGSRVRDEATWPCGYPPMHHCNPVIHHLSCNSVAGRFEHRPFRTQTFEEISIAGRPIRQVLSLSNYVA